METWKPKALTQTSAVGTFHLGVDLGHVVDFPVPVLAGIHQSFIGTDTMLV